MTESRIAAAAPADDAEDLSLLVMTESGVLTCPLPPRGEIVVGRSDACDLRVDDAKLSRRHAVLRVLGGGRVEIVDLRSLNGTTIGGRRVAPDQPAPVRVGDTIAIGATVIVLQRAGASSRPWRLFAHDDLLRRLASEHARASRSPAAAPFALMKLRFRHARDADAIEEVLGDSLRKKDLVAAEGPGIYEVLLVETHAVVADAMTARIAAQLRERGVRVDVHVAVFGRDGDTPRALVASDGVPPSGRGDPEPPEGVVLGGAMKRLEPIVTRVAESAINVLLLGETGVGKEVLARTIHARSPRARGPLVCIHCAALSESLLESELFGHERGAFTGAVAAKEGLLESARGGTVFLDEIGEMALPLQAKLLRVLEQREVTPVGALRPRAIDVRFVAATNRDLEAESARGRFRSDLFFRLNGIALTIPPLRDRVDEIAPLARAFLRRACDAAGRGDVTISAQAMALLQRYAWPGNVRELRNVIERAVLLSSGDRITLEHLPYDRMGPVVDLRAPRGGWVAAPTVAPPGGSDPVAIADAERTDPFAAPRAPSAAPTANEADEANAANAAGGPDEHAAATTLPHVRSAAGRGGHPGDARAPAPRDDERRRILVALEKCAGNQTRAAKILGISRRTLVTRLSAYDLPRPRKKPGDS